MPEKITAEAIFSEIAEKIADTVPKQKSISFFEDDRSNTVSSQFNRLFGRQKPVYHLLGGGKCMISIFDAFYSSSIMLGNSP